MTPAQEHRGIKLPGSANLRDVGGYVAHTGVTRWRTLLRAGALDRLDAGGWTALADLGIRTVVDLREPVERERDPDDVADPRIHLYERPLIEGRIDLTVEHDLGAFYREVLATCGRALADVVRLLCEPDALPALVHCSAGKDRTGLLIALVLSSVGVPDDVVVEDYALTSLHLDAGAREELGARAMAAGLREQALAAMMDAPPGLMRAVLRDLRVQCGGAAEYLLAHGLAHAELGSLRLGLVQHV
jgi:protein-tyrosine phosphatase